MSVEAKFLTLNLFEGGLLMDNILKFLREEQPDVLFLQEVRDGKDPSIPENFRSIEILKKELNGYHYVFNAEANWDTKYGPVEEGNAIFSRFPIVDTDVEFFVSEYDPHYDEEGKNGDFSMDPHNIQHAKIDLGNGTFINAFNVHGVWWLKGEEHTPSREEMRQVIVNQIKNRENVVLAGDFNLKPDSETIRSIENYLVDVFKGKLSSTFNMAHKTNPGYATAVVDFILASPNLKIKKAHMPLSDVSDHRPLICVLEV